MALTMLDCRPRKRTAQWPADIAAEFECESKA
jgi:hypothetical protein